MNPRFEAIMSLGSRNKAYFKESREALTSEDFGVHAFNRKLMRKTLPKDVFNNVVNAYNGKETIKPEFADSIAVALKEWANSHGATHYSHWFQPLSGLSAEKHDAFIDWSGPAEVIEKFSGGQLVQGEPDASSFPSGGLRTTYEARGYTSWDPTSPPFIWKGGDGIVLCIPSVFYSWTGDVLDFKIPLLRSDKKINDACLRLLALTGIKADFVTSTLGLEQEYFVVDRVLRNLRPDLVLSGRTLFGAASPKGQELQDHYFGSVKDRVQCFMQEFENEALKLAIPVKTRHNEVAPTQYEVAPVFEKASTAVDHNILLMELMRHTAEKHQLSCLLHEKPFNGLNGSGKHLNWALMTSTGLNLLDPSDMPENNLPFLILITAVLKATYEHHELLRASVGSAHNDHRLGGHEAPPAIISVYLGHELEEVLDQIEEKGLYQRKKGKGTVKLGISSLLELPKHNSDRNRTSPFAFTGNKFEMRALGSSSNPAFTTSVMNSTISQSLNEILDEIEKRLGGKKKASKEELIKEVFPVIRKYLKKTKNIRFSGDNYSEAWSKEAKKRKITDTPKSVYAFEALTTNKTADAFEGVLTSEELRSRYEILLETYSHHINIEAKTMLDLFRSMILPVAFKHQKNLAKSVSLVLSVDEKSPVSNQRKLLKEIGSLIEKGITLANSVEKLRGTTEKLPLVKQGKAFCDQVLPKCEELRKIVDALEGIIEDELWPLPKYRELLYML